MLRSEIATPPRPFKGLVTQSLCILIHTLSLHHFGLDHDDLYKNLPDLYAASLTAAAYEHQPQFDAFRHREGLEFRSYETFGKDEQRERRDLLLALANRIWAPERIERYTRREA